jgi:hypothetical protein
MALLFIAMVFAWLYRRALLRERWLRHCYVDLGDWSLNRIQAAPMVAADADENAVLIETEWAERIARHKRVLRAVGVELTSHDAVAPD